MRCNGRIRNTILGVVLAFCLTLCGCAQYGQRDSSRQNVESQSRTEETVSTETNSAILPPVQDDTKQAEANAEMYSESEQIASEQKTDTKYVLNRNTKKFHYSDCVSVRAMSEKNKLPSNEDWDTIIARGYSPCGRCNP